MAFRSGPFMLYCQLLYILKDTLLLQLKQRIVQIKIHFPAIAIHHFVQRERIRSIVECLLKAVHHFGRTSSKIFSSEWWEQNFTSMWISYWLFGSNEPDSPDWLNSSGLLSDWLSRKTTPWGLIHIWPSYYFRFLQILSVWSVQPPVIRAKNTSANVLKY